jgi:hypothetical protein
MEFMERVAPVVDDTIRALAKTKFIQSFVRCQRTGVAARIFETIKPVAEEVARTLVLAHFGARPMAG